MWKPDFGPFERAIRRTSGGQPFQLAKIEPKVEIIEPADPTQPPEQVKITIPLKEADPKSAAYGVIVSLGWLDPDRSQAKRVKKVKVSKLSVKVGDDPRGAERGTGGGSEGEWQVRIGVNGRWEQRRRNNVITGDEIKFEGIEFNLHLAEDDFVQVAAHGEDGQGARHV
ncbi:MAG: hypothetical protein WKF84_30860 [Pyrinomonadaceae bacterium]